MKKILLGVLTTLVLLNVNAQTDQGNLFIGGNLNFGNASYLNPDSTGSFKGNSFDFAIAPEFGYFVEDNFAIGATLFFGMASTKTYDVFYSGLRTQKGSEIGFGGGVFGQYFIELNKNLYLTFKGTLAYYNFLGETSTILPGILGSPETTTIGLKSSISKVSFTVIPSIEYFVSDNLSLSLGFGDLYFSQVWAKDLLLVNPESVSSTNFGLDLDLSTLRFGMKFYLNN